MIVSCVVTHNRLELTKATIASYLATVPEPASLVVFDNASTDGTREWLAEGRSGASVVLQSAENLFPGEATNVSWNLGLARMPDAQWLHRSDNDVEYLSGWCDEVARLLGDGVGQVGLRTLEEEGDFPNVGGNCVISRAVWDAGVRWQTGPWKSGETEDGPMSAAVRATGFGVVRVERPCLIHRGVFDPADPYYDRPGHPNPR